MQTASDTTKHDRFNDRTDICLDESQRAHRIRRSNSETDSRRDAWRYIGPASVQKNGRRLLVMSKPMDTIGARYRSCDGTTSATVITFDVPFP